MGYALVATINVAIEWIGLAGLVVTVSHSTSTILQVTLVFWHACFGFTPLLRHKDAFLRQSVGTIKT
jgi:hypothetical protein